MRAAISLLVCLSIGTSGCASPGSRPPGPAPPPGVTPGESAQPAVSLGEQPPGTLDTHVEVEEHPALGQRPSQQWREENTASAP